MGKAKTLAISAAALALAGCATGRWYHPTGTEAQFNRDSYECQMQAASVYPVQMTNTSTGYQAPVRTNCTTMGNQMNCTSTQQQQMPIYQYDQNQALRANAQGQCLRARGWTYR